MAKKKKEKIVYYDDDSTLVDMTNVARNGKKEPSKVSRRQSTAREKWRTYWASVKTMFFPMLIVLSILAILYVLMMWLGGNF